MNKSADSAACPHCIEFQAVIKLGQFGIWTFKVVIKSAASAASRKPESRGPKSRGAPDGGSAGGRRPRGTPLELPSLDLGFLDAALAADLITA